MIITVPVFHSAAAFFHIYVIKNKVLLRMWPRY